jgi:hypothetical protein
MNLNTSGVNVEFEFAPDPAWYRSEVQTLDNLKTHLEDFFGFLNIELI